MTTQAQRVMRGQAQAARRRDRALAAAVKAFDRAHGLMLDAIRHNDEVGYPDALMALDLARCADNATAAKRVIAYELEHARLRRRDHDRQVAAETAGGAT